MKFVIELDRDIQILEGAKDYHFGRRGQTFLLGGAGKSRTGFQRMVLAYGFCAYMAGDAFLCTFAGVFLCK